MNSIKLFRDALAVVDGEHLLMSRLHCHARNVSSIVLSGNAYGGLTRVFLAWPEHDLWMNHPTSPRWSVGVHDHRYDLNLSRVCGSPVNIVFSAPTGTRYPIAVRHYKFTSGVRTGRPESRFVGDCEIEPVEICEVPDSGGLHLVRHALHTIYVPRGQMAAWKVVERAASTDRETNLYTNAPSVECSGLYEPFADRRSVVEHVEKFIGAFQQTIGEAAA